jgi:hypothetical protein
MAKHNPYYQLSFHALKRCRHWDLLHARFLSN